MRWLALLLLFVLPATLGSQDSIAIYLDRYEVQEGDYLSKLGDWESIYELNKETVGDDPNLIHPESTLYIPVGSSYIKGKETNYHLQAWAFVIIAGIFVAVRLFKKAQAPVIHVSAPITERYVKEPMESGGNGSLPDTRKQRIGEVSLTGAEGKNWLDEEAKEVSLPTEKIK